MRFPLVLKKPASSRAQCSTRQRLPSWPLSSDSSPFADRHLAPSYQYNFNRWYDASVGRWLSEDPTGFVSHDANLCRYVSNGPLVATDPQGLIEWLSTEQTVQAAKKELEGSTSGKALIAAIEALEKKKDIQVSVFDAYQKARELLKPEKWEAMPAAEKEAFLRDHAHDSHAGPNVVCGHLDVVINPYQSKPGDPRQSWYATGPKREDVRLWDRLSENLFHELVHAKRILQGEAAIARKPSAAERAGITEDEWTERWGSFEDYAVVMEMKSTYYAEFKLAVPWAWRSTQEQNEYAEELKRKARR